jgi:hypothetical protein
MAPHTLRRIILVCMLAFLGLAASGCGFKPDGKYIAGGGVMTVEFNSGQATITSMVSQPETCPYDVSGDKITIHSKSAGDLVLTHMQDGSLQGNGITLTKAAN